MFKNAFKIITVTLIAAALTAALVLVAFANDAELFAYQDGTSYSFTHSVNADTQALNEAKEAHAFYYYCQNSEYLPVQAYYVVYPHLEADVSLTMDCNISFEVCYKALGFLWETTSTATARVTYDDLYDEKTLWDI